jgi:preprotein translocase subunit SecY
LGVAVPYFQKLQKEGESGRKKINQITRYLTVIITAAQAPAYLANLAAQLPREAITPFDGDPGASMTFFIISSVIILICRYHVCNVAW